MRDRQPEWAFASGLKRKLNGQPALVKFINTSGGETSANSLSSDNSQIEDAFLLTRSGLTCFN